jgi:hypothetical protein
VIFSDSLSWITTLDEMRKIYNPKVVRMIHREKEHINLKWVLGQGNKKADQHKTVAEDWKNCKRDKGDNRKE